ncbi:Short stop-like protein [Leptotrombidium deliense]|uniref:Short stop-like protein n=1 Tax=Leptotrombidium deliense TaxID=299467 RepID=A0A443S0Y4_9ACAR|nr:Short stop-like protein [Leptotrombidium deliense]
MQLQQLLDETVKLYDSPTKMKWRVKTSSRVDIQVFGVCIVIPPPEEESIEVGENLKKRYDAFVNMDPHQRNSIIRALDNDIKKLVQEGSPNDPGSKRFQDEMIMKSIKTLTARFTDATEPIYDFLTEKERILKQRVQNAIPRDRDILETSVLEHKKIEIDIQSYEPRNEKND